MNADETFFAFMARPKTVRSVSAPKNRVRIIGGTYRSRVIDFPDSQGLRPTPGRVRETLFNWLGQTLHGKRCLDLFAGSGALGFEAASRGASEVFMIETQPAAVAALHESRRKLAAEMCHVVSGDALDWLRRNQQRFDIIFVDPPFSSGLLPAVLRAIAPRLNEQGVVYAEWGESVRLVLAREEIGQFAVAKEDKAGASHFALLSAQPTVTEAST